MEQKILHLLNDKYQMDFTEITPVTNEIYKCTVIDATYYVRVTNYKSYEEQLEEVNYTNFLHEEGFGVVPAITSINKKLVEEITLNDNPVSTVLYQSAPGIHLPRNQWNATVLKELGRQIGRLHHLSKKFEKRHPTKHIKDWHKNEEYAFLKYIPPEESTIRSIAKEVLTNIQNIPKNNSNFGLLHGDLCQENVLVGTDLNLTMIDFQDCEKHYYIYDLAVPIYSALEYSFVGGSNIVDFRQEIIKAIVEGYQEENELSADMLDQLPLFIKLKEVFEYSLMHMYWDKDKLTEEQIRVMNHFRMRIELNYSLLDS